MSDESIDGYVEFDPERDGYVLHPDPTMPGGETAQEEFTPAGDLDVPGVWDEELPGGDLLPDDLFSPRPADTDPSVWDVLENLLPGDEHEEGGRGLGLEDDPNYAPEFQPINEAPEDGLA